MKRFSMLSLVLAAALFCSNALAAVTIEGEIPTKPAEGAYNLNTFLDDVKSNKVVVIDVRTPGEYAMGHLPEATNLPIGTLENELKNFHKDKTVVFMCAAGKRAGSAYYLVKDKAPDLVKNVHFLDAAVQYKSDGDVVIKPNK